MKLFYKLISRLLIASIIFFPFSANAALVGTEVAIASTHELANRDKVMDLASREQVSNRLQALGLSASSAQERVDAMTQDEVNKLAGKIDTLPAGAMADGWWWVIGVLVVGGIIYAVWGPGKTRR